MDSASPTHTAATPAPNSARLWGLDLARTLALLAMTATHTLPLYTSETVAGVLSAQPTLVGMVFAGRAAVLFAVLAGAALVLMRNKSLVYVWTRSALLVLFGVGLELLDTGVYVILVPLATAMAVTALVRRCSGPVLGLLAVVWLGLTPWLQQWVNVQAAAPSGSWWRQYAHFKDLSPESWFAYPVLIWIGYTLLGAALMAWLRPAGSNPVTGTQATPTRPAAATPMLVWALVVLATGVAVLLWVLGARTIAELASNSVVATGLWTGNYVPGLPGVTALWQLPEFHLLPTPHSAAAAAVWQHAAIAVVVVVLAARLPALATLGSWARYPLEWLSGIGRWSLSTYVWHLVVLAAVRPYGFADALVAVIVFGAVALLGLVAMVSGGRGPLEWLIATIGT
ncbi:heparan-alpha-glucosaminide N-acetyltransferase domain-containing protein [Micrococcoides hystricis]|uniref:Heparan-alpha-glucosaminide N-acetyltransferase domain-containing protein n=1 Tax=Micrococcoides hystricis TaxID=1572761 RepID=A0ABV6P8L3_9MICC